MNGRTMLATPIPEAVLLEDLHPTTRRLMQQVAEMDDLIRDNLGRQQVQITVRSVEGKPAKDCWYSVH